MTDPNRKVKNPLFNASVTGSTFEEFSQNAVILPAVEKPPTPIQAPLQDESLNSSGVSTPAILQPVEDSFQQSHQGFQTENLPPIEPIISPFSSSLTTRKGPEAQQAPLSAVFSSFGNILKIGFGSQGEPEAQPPLPQPTGIETLLNQDNTNAPPVPLFSPTEPIVGPPRPPTTQGPVNTFRRGAGSKRPVYAQPPGLTGSSPTTSHLENSQLPTTNSSQNYFQPPQISAASNLTPFPPSQPQDQSFNTQHQFKPISPPQPVFSNTSSPIQQPPVIQATPSSSHSSYPFQHSTIFSGVRTQSQGPVMAAMPASEMVPTEIGPVASAHSTSGIPPGPHTQSQLGYKSQVYRPVYHHWFYKREIEQKSIWQPFSMVDSLALEEAFTSNDLDPDKVIATDGGRYDVNILRRQRTPVYWTGNSTEVRRCSWFHKDHSDGRFVPYEENVATMLEEEFRLAFEANQWQKKVQLSNGDTVVFQNPDVLVLFPPSPVHDAWGTPANQARPRIVKRGMDEFNIEEGEPAKVDHLLFMVHGIGSVCDLRFRTVEEVVEEFRNIALQLVQSHYKSSCEKGTVNKVEVLPISWHEKLHSEELDSKLKSITLESIPKLRDFTNTTLLDILFYTSPVFCQVIISAVGNELNRIYGIFKERNPDFNGGVSLGGHSLGSLILFDLLSHQHEIVEEDKTVVTNNEETVTNGEDTVEPIVEQTDRKRKASRKISYMVGNAGTGQPQIYYPHLNFNPSAFFALGSPIGMFVTIRGLDKLGDDFKLPTCPAFFNIFHPYDPIAYRVETLINPDLAQLKPVLIPHHKGRKRMHLELKETMARVGADLKQKVYESMKNTWNTFYQLAMFQKAEQPPSLEEEVNKAFEKQLQVPDICEEEPPQEATDLPLGVLNKGRRVDYVLQEAPFEIFNEYIFALKSHVCYWDSEDTMLLMLKEIYSSMGISADNQIPQQTMTIERPPLSPKSQRSRTTSEVQQGVDPTAPIQPRTNLQPPPTSGFVRKT